MKASYFSRDIQEFICLLGKHGVRYLIVGGEAVIYYGYARFTGDVDFFYEPSRENARRLFDALEEFWQGDIPGLSHWCELTEKGIVLQFGAPPNRIDLINEIDGVDFEEAWENRREENLEGGVCEGKVYFIGLEQLIKNKKASGRYKDLEDLKYLEALWEKKKSQD